MESLGESVRRAMEADRPNRPSTAPAIPTARSIMTTKLVCLRPTHTIGEAIALLLKHAISGAPVIDGSGKLIGMLSEADCMRALAASRFHGYGDPHQRTVSELMSTTLVTVNADTDIYTITDRFLSDNLRRLPVLQGDELVGQVSRRDVLKAMQQMW